jgi:hypothetical protein
MIEKVIKPIFSHKLDAGFDTKVVDALSSSELLLNSR